MKINFNLHTLITIILAVVLLAIIMFGPSVESNQYENELNYLKQTNQLLIFKNDSISSLNDTLQQEITRNLLLIDSTTKVLEISKNEIDYLNKKRNEIPDIINSMSSDDITTALTDYLKRRN